MVAAFVAGDLVERVGLPRITAYVVVGALFSEPVLGGMIPGSPGAWSDALANLSLAVIAFILGAEIDIQRLRSFGRPLGATLVGQTLGTFGAVALALWGLASLFAPLAGRIDWGAALVFGAIASATAPAATVAVIEEYRARGDLTSMLFGLVALDDVVGILLFTLAIGLLGEAALAQRLLMAGSEIGLSVAAGAGLGFVLGLFGRHIATGDLRLPVIVGVVILNFGLAARYEYSDLLSSILLGLVAMVVFHYSQRAWLDPLNHIRDTIFLIFFTLAGTHFDPAIFVSALPLIIAYVLARAAGKYGGTYAAARLTRADEKVRRYLGLALLPHAGVAIGLALRAAASPGMEQVGTVLLNTVIGATIVFELTSPWLAKFALQKAGEIGTER